MICGSGQPVDQWPAVTATACPGNDDYFTFGAAAGAAIAVDTLFSHAAGDLDIEVFNPDGTVLQSSTSSDDNESIDVVAVQDGPHAVRVYGLQDASNSYELTATVTTACADDGLEPNDLRAQGSPLTSGQAVSAKVVQATTTTSRSAPQRASRSASRRCSPTPPATSTWRCSTRTAA